MFVYSIFSLFCVTAISGTLAWDRWIGSQIDIYAMRDDGEPFAVTNSPENELYPEVSNDGEWIAYGGYEGDNAEVFICRAVPNGGQNRINISNHPAYDGNPEWSPDDNSLIFLSSRGNGFPNLWILNINGNTEKQFTHGFFFDGYPAWSNNGTWIAWQSDRSGRFEIYKAPAKDTDADAIQLTGPNSNSGIPAWSPDDRRIAFTSTQREGMADVFMMQQDGAFPQNLTSKDKPQWHPTWRGGQILFYESSVGIFSINPENPIEPKQITFDKGLHPSYGGEFLAAEQKETLLLPWGVLK